MKAELQKNKKALSGLIVLALLALLAGSLGGSTRATQAKAHPMLLELAEAAPEQVVSVIVQKAGSTQQMEALADKLGGRVTKDLSLINAFAAEMSAGVARRLASHPGVRWISPDAAVTRTDDLDAGAAGKRQNDIQNYFLDTLEVRPVWEMGLKGQGIGVAVIDSGIAKGADFTARAKKTGTSRLLVELSFSAGKVGPGDESGHGTHVAGIAGGNGATSQGRYTGIAPMVNLLSLKISDKDGMAYESDAVAAMQWVFEHKDEYNIRVVNLSLNSSLQQSYHTSPMDAAAEILWFNGVVVVVSAGNTSPEMQGNPIDAAPANDPFFISVGASTENGTPDPADDTVAGFSAYGTTLDGFAKPDIVAPGKDIVSVMARNSPWLNGHKDHLIYGGRYFRLSGTSMSAPMVTGAVALLLQDEPYLTPDQVKFRLVSTANSLAGEDGNAYPYLNVFAAVTGESAEMANTGLTASQMLWTGDNPVAWDSVSWNSVSWNSVSWNSVSWNSVSWNSVSWNSVAWDE